MKLSQVAAQLYTCRDTLKTPKDIAATLSRVRKIGYTAVQVSAMAPIPEDELNKMLDGEGLVCCATHEPGATILAEPQKVVDRLHKLRCSYTAYPNPAGIDLTVAANVEDLIQKLDAAGKVLKDAGLTLCYHNHARELVKLNGRTVLDRIYEGTNPAHLQGEPDTYWIHFGGCDNVEWCEKLAGRMPLIHLKDYFNDAKGVPAMGEIGAGNLNFKKIVAAAEKSGCQWFIVEQDICPGDPFDSLAQSFDYIKAHLVD